MIYISGLLILYDEPLNLKIAECVLYSGQSLIKALLIKARKEVACSMAQLFQL